MNAQLIEAARSYAEGLSPRQFNLNREYIESLASALEEAERSARAPLTVEWGTHWESGYDDGDYTPYLVREEAVAEVESSPTDTSLVWRYVSP